MKKVLTQTLFFADILAFVMIVGNITTWAGGFKIQDQSTRGMGMADAYIAGVEDSSAIYYNPAALTKLSRPEFMSNLYIAHSTTYYDGENVDFSSDNRTYLVPNIYAATPLEDYDKLSLGIGFYSPFGLGSQWGDNFPPNTNNQRILLGEIALVNVNPTVAYEISDRLSIGVGIDYLVSQVDQKYTRIYGPTTEGDVKLDGFGHDWGYNLGLQWQVSEDIIFGLTYRSQIKVDYDGEMKLENFPIMTSSPSGMIFRDIETDLETQIDYPAILGTGISWQATDALRFELAAEWTKWSTRSKQVIETDGVPGVMPAKSQPQNLDWQDSWVYMLGAEYNVSEKWTIRTGYGYNETPIPDHTADPTQPTGDTHALAIGASYKATESLLLDIAALVSYSEERTLTEKSNAPPGDYDAVGTLFSVGARYQF